MANSDSSHLHASRVKFATTPVLVRLDFNPNATGGNQESGKVAEEADIHVGTDIDGSVSGRTRLETP
jgi:hypothetical protein